MLAIIPARGGSKGVPRKNIKNLAGHPLIYYTIKAAQESKKISRIVVSTDDDEIAEVSRKCGAEVPFLRPSKLASDSAKAIDAYLYTVLELSKASKHSIDDFIVLLPTTPFRTSEDIDNAIGIFHQKNADTVISVVKAEHPPSWYKKISSEGVLEDYFPQTDNSLNRQEAEATYLPNGAIYIFKYEVLKRNYSYYNPNTYPYIMSQDRSLDIDTVIDFRLADLLMEEKN